MYIFYERQCVHIIPVGMSCHFSSECGGTPVPFPVDSISKCCLELKGSSISFTANGGTCQPCIGKLTPITYVCVLSSVSIYMCTRPMKHELVTQWLVRHGRASAQCVGSTPT